MGLGLAAGARLGAVRSGTAFLALLTGCLLVLVSALPKNIETRWRNESWRPADAAAVQPRYEVGTGTANLDLTAVDPGGRTLRVAAEVGAGRLEVRVPDTVRVRVRADTDLGVIQLHGERAAERGEDIDVLLDGGRSAVLVPTAPPERRHEGTIRLDLRVGFGQVVVVREAA
jgi:hypothetical protein